MAEGGVVLADHFSRELRAPAPASPAREVNRDPVADARESAATAERRRIEEALHAEGGNQTRAAARLGMPRRTLVYKLARYRRGE